MESTIDNLPEDVFLHIFGYLDGNSLKNSALVCKIWNDVICGSSRMTKNFTLNLCDNTMWTEKIDEILSLTRRFQSMKVTLHSTSLLHSYDETCSTADKGIDLLKQVSEKHGTNMRRLLLINAEFKNPKDLYEILSSMPLLQELVLIRVKFDVEEKFTHHSQSILNKLNKLTIHTCDWNIFEFFMASPIKELKISNKFSLVDGQQLSTYIKFLEVSDNIESIEFDLMAYAKTFQTRLGKIGFKLKKLKYFSFSPSYETGDIDRHFESFLESQASSLMELDLNYVLPSTTKIIFTKLKVLEKLRFNAVVLPTNNDFYGSFKKMLNLRELTLHDDIPSEAAAREILINCSNLETLNAHHDPGQYIPNLLPFIAANCPMVKRLSLDTLVPVPPEIKFDRLKLLHIQSCINFEYLITFLNNNAAIETLSLNLVEEANIPDETIIESLLSQSSLQHLIVTAGYNALRVIYNKIKQDYKKLKSLELQTLSQAVDNIYINFPTDKSKWQPYDTFFDDDK